MKLKKKEVFDILIGGIFFPGGGFVTPLYPLTNLLVRCRMHAEPPGEKFRGHHHTHTLLYIWYAKET